MRAKVAVNEVELWSYRIAPSLMAGRFVCQSVFDLGRLCLAAAAFKVLADLSWQKA
jgi:hypothetical protein